MPTTFSLSLSPNYKPTFAKHRKWKAGVLTNGESWPRVFGSSIQTSADFYLLGIKTIFNLTAPTTSVVGASAPGTYGIVTVYRSSKFIDGLSGDNIQSNPSNTVDVTLAANQSAVLTKVTTTDTKVTAIDIYAAIKVSGAYGTFFRVVKDATNSAGTVTFDIQASGFFLISATVTNGTADNTAVILATDNDPPTAQPIALEVNGRLLLCGGITKRVTATFTNGSPTVTTAETIYDGIYFWFIRRDSDTSGGVDGRGTYLCNFVSSSSVTLVDASGASVNYTGTTGTETATIFPEPNRSFSKPLNPHAFPVDNISNDYPGAILAAGKVPNTNRVLLMGSAFVIAEDYDRLPLEAGLNYVSTEYGCSSQFSIVEAHSRLYWLDIGKSKRQICYSDGATVQLVSTQKIKSILNRVTLDSNSEPFRIGYIHGIYFKNEDVIRWGLYLDNNTVPNFILELDLVTGDVRNDPTFFAHRYLDVFTYGTLRGRPYIGQFGYDPGIGIARIGLDNVDNRYYDWGSGSGTISGTLATSGQTMTVLTIASGTLDTAGDGLKGIQVLVWQESTAGTSATLIANRTYYHCRISDNDATTFTINYVETMTAAGAITNVDVALPVTPSGVGWNFRACIIQGMIGPKFFTGKETKTRSTFRELSVVHQGQNVAANTDPILTHFYENFDPQPKDAQYMEAAQEGQQVSSTSNYAASFARPTTNPVDVMGFSLVDNNVSSSETTALNIETIVLDYNEATQQGQGG